MAMSYQIWRIASSNRPVYKTSPNYKPMVKIKIWHRPGVPSFTEAYTVNFVFETIQPGAAKFGMYFHLIDFYEISCGPQCQNWCCPGDPNLKVLKNLLERNNRAQTDSKFSL